MKLDIQDQTLAMYLEETLGVEIEYANGVKPIDLIKETLAPGSTMVFSFKVPNGLNPKTIIQTVQKYFAKTAETLRLDESGLDEGSSFWIFGNRKSDESTFVRCWMHHDKGVFSVD